MEKLRSIVAVSITVAALAMVAVISAAGPTDGDTSTTPPVVEATTGQSKAPCQDIAHCPPPANRSRFLTETGYFNLPQWDDRRISEQEKALDPMRDPFWPPFIECLESAGLATGIASPALATQADINRLVDQVNSGGPFYFTTPTGLEYRGTAASDAFINCEVILYEKRPPGNP